MWCVTSVVYDECGVWRVWYVMSMTCDEYDVWCVTSVICDEWDVCRFQEMDLSAQALIGGESSKEDIWISSVEQTLLQAASYHKVSFWEEVREGGRRAGGRGEGEERGREKRGGGGGERAEGRGEGGRGRRRRRRKRRVWGKIREGIFLLLFCLYFLVTCYVFLPLFPLLPLLLPLPLPLPSPPLPSPFPPLPSPPQLCSIRMVGVMLLVYIRTPLLEVVSDVSTELVTTGIGGILVRCSMSPWQPHSNTAKYRSNTITTP